MRKELIEIEKIERYLLNKMSASEKIGFEQEIESNPKLKAKVEAQKTVMDAVQRMALKKSAKNAYKSYKLKSLLTKLIVLVAVLAVAGFVTLKFLNSEKNTEILQETTEKVNFLPKNDSISNFSNQLLDEEVFRINTKQDTVIENKDGVIIYIPANAFDTDNDNIDVLVQSAIKAEDILYAGLSTTSNGNELETGGMFYIDAFDPDKKQGENRVNLIKDLQVNVPTQNKVDGMQLYQGKKTTDGDINWINPAPLKNKLTPVDILTLDFFPPTYDNTLTNWGYPKKKFKDSLYYSFAFEEEGDKENIPLKVKEWPIGELKLMDQNDNVLYDRVIEMNNLKNNIDNNHKFSKDIVNWDFEMIHVDNDVYQINLIATPKSHWLMFPNHFENMPIIEYMPTIFKVYLPKQDEIIGSVEYHGSTLHNPKQPNMVWCVGKKIIFTQRFTSQFPTKANITIAYSADSSGIFSPSIEKHFEIRVDETLIENDKINPASIKTIWNTKFNNTNLATKEFEERLVWIHKSCNQQVLDLYINNLDKSLAEVDSMIIPLVSGEVKTKFIEFAKRNDGKVNVDDAATQKLSDYYKFKQKAEAKALVETQQNYWKEQGEKDNEQIIAENKSNVRAIENNTEVFQKEFKKNLCKVYDELDYPMDCNRPSMAPNYYSVNISRTGWNNIDKQVYVATANRKTTSFNYKGKTSSVTYNQWTGIVNDYQKFEHINVYNIPKEFKSYVKIAGQNGIYNYKLNADLTYQTVILAWTENELFYIIKDTKAGKDTFTLIKVSEQEFKTKVKSMLSNVHNMSAEIDFVANTQKDVRRQKENIKRKALRSKIKPIVFPCKCNEDITSTITEEIRTVNDSIAF